MKTYLAVLVLSALATFFFTPIVRRLAFRLKAVDQPSDRKIHAVPTARLGGLAIFGGFCVPWAGLYVWDNRVSDTFQNYEILFFSLIAGAAAMLALGVYDDIKGASAPKKFSVQFAVAIGLYFAGYRITTITNPFGEAFQLGSLSLPVTALWIVGITNAMNLLDGIDGLVTGVAAIIALSLAVINVMSGNVIVALLTLCLAGACLGFLPHNFAPARIFLGDTGSLFVGLTLACVGTLSLFKETTAALILVPLILFGLPVFDTVTVMLGRLVRNAPMFQADKTHVHHRLLKVGLNQREAAIFLYIITMLLGSTAVWLQLQQTARMEFRVAAIVIAFGGFMWLAWRLRRHKARHAAESAKDHAQHATP